VHFMTNRKKPGNMRAFLMTLESASAIFMLIIAASAFSLFSFPESSAGDFYICSDAAIILSKSRAFSDNALSLEVEKLGRLSGMCIKAEGAGSFASNCFGDSGAKKEKFSFSFPVWKDGMVQQASVGCWRKK